MHTLGLEMGDHGETVPVAKPEAVVGGRIPVGLDEGGAPLGPGCARRETRGLSLSRAAPGALPADARGPVVASAVSSDLQRVLDELGKGLEVPGAAAGVYLEGRATFAFHGVTSVENPLPVDERTLFQFGSIGKTYTAAAVLRLVEQGRIDLGAPVRTYVPELRLKDTGVADRVTVLHLFNHTAGWAGDVFDDTGDGDDAVAKYVELMATLDQVSPLGATVSYNNASLSLAGRVIEKLTGKVYEQAIRDLVLEPLGLRDTWFFPNDVMTRRFVVGHTRHRSGRLTVARPWAMPRGGNPAGGMVATAADQIAWARFHLGGGSAPDGSLVLSRATVLQMQEPTTGLPGLPGSASDDRIGISWFLRDVEGERLVEHGGSTIGQHANFVMVPAREFAVISMTNCDPNGSQLNKLLADWALEHYLGLKERAPELRALDDDTLSEYVGRYETIEAVCDITALDGRLVARVETKPEVKAALQEPDDEPEDEPAELLPLAIVEGEGEPFVVTGGSDRGERGHFSRSSDGLVSGVHLYGRLAVRSGPSLPRRRRDG